MTKYRKKPAVIEAVQIDKRMDLTSPPWWAEAVQQNRVILRGMGKFTRDLPVVEIETLEGVMTGIQGDWIILGVKGELYPCKPDIFAATYEPVDGETEMSSTAHEDQFLPHSDDVAQAPDKGEDVTLPPPSHRHPMSGEPIWDEATARAAVLADRQQRGGDSLLRVFVQEVALGAYSEDELRDKARAALAATKGESNG